MDQPTNNHRSTRRRLLPFGGAVALASLAAAGPVDAAPADDQLLRCTPIECAAAYIGVPASDLSAAVVAETRATGLPGMMVAIDQLDAAEHSKLAATGSTDGAMQALARFSIISTHDALRDLLLTYAVGNLIVPPGSF
jgi:hypothetical protein